ncbi:unnamed protein product [Calypogeia fissa]
MRGEARWWAPPHKANSKPAPHARGQSSRGEHTICRHQSGGSTTGRRHRTKGKRAGEGARSRWRDKAPVERKKPPLTGERAGGEGPAAKRGPSLPEHEENICKGGEHWGQLPLGRTFDAIEGRTRRPRGEHGGPGGGGGEVTEAREESDERGKVQFERN